MKKRGDKNKPLHSLVPNGTTSYKINITPVDVFYYDTKKLEYWGGSATVLKYIIHMDNYAYMDWMISFPVTADGRANVNYQGGVIKDAYLFSYSFHLSRDCANPTPHTP